MFKETLSRLKEASFSILPVVVMVLIFNFAIPGMTLESDGSKFGPVMVSLLISVIPLILGTALFSIGAEKSVAKIGEVVGTTLTKRKSLVLLLAISLLLGILATIAEPDLTVLASRISENGPNWSLIVISAIGVGIFLVVAILRVAYDKPLKYWLAIGYGLVFTLSMFADPDFFSIIFDAGGVTTGVITVPFIIALGMGVARVLGGENAEDDSFGYSGLCSLGTVLAAMVFSIVMKKSGALDSIQNVIAEKFDINNITSATDSMMIPLENYSQLGKLYLANALSSTKDVTLSITPIVLFFVIFNFFAKIHGKALGSIVIGFVYTFFGMVFFFLGAESGFIPLASALGKWFSTSMVAGENFLWLFVLVCVVLGFIAMLAEPSVRVLAVNVSEVSRGVISKKTIYIALGAATSLALLMNVFRVTYNIDFIYFIIPLFLIALALAFLSPDIYVGIAIDAAGVATGTMASCFFLPMFIGYASIIYANNLQGNKSLGAALMKNGFGVVGLMSVMPIIAVEVVGLIAVIKTQLAYRRALAQVVEPDDSQVIHLPSQLEESAGV